MTTKEPRKYRRATPAELQPEDLNPEYIGASAAAELLGITTKNLGVLLSRKNDAEETGATERSRASAVPLPIGRLSSSVWKRADVEAVAEEFKQLDARRKP